MAAKQSISALFNERRRSLPIEPQQTRFVYGVLMALFTGLVWSVLPILLRRATNQFSPELAILARYTVAFTGMSLLLLVRGDFAEILSALRSPNAWLAGLCLAANYYFSTKGIQLAGAVNGAILIQTGPLFLTLLSVLIYREHLRPMQVAGYAMGCAGFTFFFLDRAGFSLESSDHFMGSLSTLFGGFTWALYCVLLKRVPAGRAMQRVTLTAFLTGVLAFAPFVSFGEFPQMNFSDILLLLTLGAITLSSYFCLAEALGALPAAPVSMIITTNPFLTLIWMQALSLIGSGFIEPEPLSSRGYLGALGALIGVVLVVRRPSK